MFFMTYRNTEDINENVSVFNRVCQFTVLARHATLRVTGQEREGEINYRPLLYNVLCYPRRQANHEGRADGGEVR